MARQSTLEFDRDISATILMQLLKKQTNRSFHFYFQPESHAAFFGASPERLYKRTGNEIYTEAVAGTRSRGSRDDEDQELSNELLNSEKDVLEHELILGLGPPGNRAKVVASCLEHLLGPFLGLDR